MFSLRSLRVSVRFRHGLRDCSGVVSEAGSSGDDNTSGQLTPGAGQDTQVLSLAPELARFVTETKVDSLTHSIKVAKEKLRNRFGDKVVMGSVNFGIPIEIRCWVFNIHNSIPLSSPGLSQLCGTEFNLTSPDMWRRQFS